MKTMPWAYVLDPRPEHGGRVLLGYFWAARDGRAPFVEPTEEADPSIDNWMHGMKVRACTHRDTVVFLPEISGENELIPPSIQTDGRLMAIEANMMKFRLPENVLFKGVLLGELLFAKSIVAPEPFNGTLPEEVAEQFRLISDVTATEPYIRVVTTPEGTIYRAFFPDRLPEGLVG